MVNPLLNDALARMGRISPPSVAPLTRAPNPNFDPSKMVRGERTGRVLSALFGVDPSNRAPGMNPILQKAIMSAGMALMGAPTNRPFGQNLMGALGVGQQVAQGAEMEDGVNEYIRSANLTPTQRNLLLALPVGQKLQMMQTMGQPQEDPYLAVGGNVFNRDTGEFHTPPESPEDERTTLQKDYEYAKANGYQGTIDEFRRLSTPTTTVNVGGDQQQGLAKTRMEAVQQAILAGADVDEKMVFVDRALDLIDDAGQGFAAELRLNLKRMGRAMGIDVEGVEDTEELQTIIGQQLLDAAESLRGALSDNDIKFLKESVAGLGREPETNRRIFERMKQALDRARAVRQHAVDYARRNNDVIGWDYFDERERLYGDLFNSEHHPENPYR